MKKASWVILLVVAAACLWAAGRLNRPLLERRASREHARLEQLRDAPPLVVFTTVALGGFRGLIADLLWVRAMDLQDEGKYFEIAQLADWITKLEPHFTQVWAFHAWNMAYNISIFFPEPADRWRWVENGIRLLRDEGIRYNPADPMLYRELGWLYYHKIGGPWDSAHLYYRRQLADQVEDAMGGPTPDYARLTAAGSETGRRLREELKLDPAVMRQIDGEYGPLDWRTPEAQAVYWGYRGVQAGGGKSLECARLIFQSMSATVRQGRVILDREHGFLMTMPRTDLAWQALRAYEQAEPYGESSVRVAQANFLDEAMLLLATLDETAEARKLYEVLRRHFPAEAGKGFEEHLRDLAGDRMRSQSQADAESMVEESVYQALIWSALDEPRRATGLLKFARGVWEAIGVARSSSGHGVAPMPPFGDVVRRTGERLKAELPEPLRSKVADVRLEPANQTQ